MQKKILAIVMVILMLASLAACSNTPVNAEQIGVYSGTSIVMDGEEITAADFAIAGQDISTQFSLELKGDCTFILISGGATFNGTYDYQAPKLVLDLEGDKLTTSIDGNKIILDLSDTGTDLKINLAK